MAKFVRVHHFGIGSTRPWEWVARSYGFIESENGGFLVSTGLPGEANPLADRTLYHSLEAAKFGADTLVHTYDRHVCGQRCLGWFQYAP